MSDALLSSTDAYKDTLSKGTLLGLRKAGTLVDEIVTTRNASLEHERRRHDAANIAPDRRQRTAALYGSPAWARTLTK